MAVAKEVEQTGLTSVIKCFEHSPPTNKYRDIAPAYYECLNSI